MHLVNAAWVSLGFAVQELLDVRDAQRGQEYLVQQIQQQASEVQAPFPEPAPCTYSFALQGRPCRVASTQGVERASHARVRELAPGTFCLLRPQNKFRLDPCPPWATADEGSGAV